MKINGKEVVSINPVCSKDNQPILCTSLGVKRNESIQCKFCNMKNKIIVRCEK